MIDLQHVNKSYGQGATAFHVLKDINLHIDQGEFVAIMGPSGSGKSTLINIIGFLDTAFEGKYFFQDENVADFNATKASRMRNRHVGFVFQNFSLIHNLNIFENVLIPLSYGGHRRSEVRGKISELLESVGLTGMENKLPRNLSGGQQQRVAIARALANSPQFLIADEPTGALDSHTSADIMQLFKELHRKGGTIIMVTHDEHVAEQSDRMIKILDGQIISDTEVAHATK
ncbi:ABC transporter ATP-binding protein [Lacticaseibacillus zeae]|uniref:ABC transporter ATP-binding protein n=1 Tax=Lacticaseibacillus zeae subsp. silagei TaxID=3068307 RepID=A0ABD7Z9M0_LACZE|nr:MULTISPECIES: ABC transporter ATP-binding protein [Lacticaseibacillus]MDE3316821.1 ABC transporter ATP-binding protein [Lacticaseibacillus zeae]OFR98354.1 peptide ABC transporter ATP-binding protein [Lactobacillus sp. HMSC068F07]WLV83606.1 ABC transporter ATP-binding protein [Lacticaseibacillus sp. NCIMB 15475]WLV86362.1 ABC transporter ATP-binding protein [Lacticaseibacillus sp. NCIMB 15474]